MIRNFLVVAAVAALSLNAFADDSAETLFSQAKQAFAKRSDLVQNDAAIKFVETALTRNASGDLKYDLLVLGSRAYYWRGQNADSRDAKLAAFGKGLDLAKAAESLDDSYAEGFYYHAINLGRWAEAKGIFESLGRKGELIDAAENAEAALTREGEAGETVDSYGPARTLGRVYIKLPGIAGGSREISLKYLEKAYKMGTDNVLNTVYYAYTLAEKSADKDKAKQILDLIINNPNHEARVNPNRQPEVVLEMKEAVELRNKLGR